MKQVLIIGSAILIVLSFTVLSAMVLPSRDRIQTIILRGLK